jgi:diguanylate cyclase (GGDEF)-like protein
MTRQTGTCETKAARKGFPRQAALLLASAALAAVIAAAASRMAADPIVADDRLWASFAVLAVGAAVAQLFVVITPKNQSYHCTLAFIIPAVFVLPPAWLLPLCVLQHGPEWVKLRYPWYIQSFNAVNYTLNALAAWGAAALVMRAGIVEHDAGLALAAAAAALAFVVTNHGLLATMLKAARGHGYRESGLFTLSSLSTDLAVACCGIALVGFWAGDRWLAVATLATLFLIQRSLAVPALEQETRLDPKTGLFNAAHFSAELTQELERSRRFDRPLAIVMADLDLLRDVNNTYGHVAGDVVLAGIAEILQEEVRSYDLAARFGGEEFALLLPETTLAEAIEIAERIRSKLAHTRFTVPGHKRAIKATVSCGVAGCPAHDDDATTLIQVADAALYEAKARGRNRVSVAPPFRTVAERTDGAAASVVHAVSPRSAVQSISRV